MIAIFLLNCSKSIQQTYIFLWVAFDFLDCNNIMYVAICINLRNITAIWLHYSFLVIYMYKVQYFMVCT